MGLFDAEDELGKEVQAKREADRAKKAMADKAKADAIKAQEQHEEDKRQGMI